MSKSIKDINQWVEVLRNEVLIKSPELLEIFDVYSTEAKFGREFISESLDKLDSNASILEVGAGSVILSSQLAREGFKITALEPIGFGFSHFEKLKSIVLNFAKMNNCLPKILEIPAEKLALIERFDFAFSINVMEHVGDVNEVIKNVGMSLKESASYKFICPNYSFPYEPHFNIPTLFSKTLTEKVFSKRIHDALDIDNPTELWLSLSWISVLRIRKIVSVLQGFKVDFNKNTLEVMILRTMDDPQFSMRRSIWLKQLLNVFVKLGLHKLIYLIPSEFNPVIDCTVTKLPSMARM